MHSISEKASDRPCHVYRITVHFRVIKSFRHKGLKRLFEKDSPSGVRADQADRIREVLGHLDSAFAAKDLDLPGFRLHALKGDRKNCWSVAISGNWRITFRFSDGHIQDVDLEDYH